MALIGAGAKLDLQDNQGQTALMIAASYGNSQIVDALARAGARRIDTSLDQSKPGSH